MRDASTLEIEKKRKEGQAQPNSCIASSCSEVARSPWLTFYRPKPKSTEQEAYFSHLGEEANILDINVTGQKQVRQ